MRDMKSYKKIKSSRKLFTYLILSKKGMFVKLGVLVKEFGGHDGKEKFFNECRLWGTIRRLN